MKQNPQRIPHGLRPVCAHTGFTLVELLLVIALAAILLALALPSFNAVLQRYRVSTAAHQIASVLQFARAEAVRSRTNITVGQTASQADSSCTPDTATPKDWQCGVDVYATVGTPLKTIPASSFHTMHVQISPGTLDGMKAAKGTGNTLVYSPMGYTTCADDECANNGPSGVDSLIYVWPTALGSTPSPTISVIHTVCATMAGKVRVIATYVANCKN